MWSSKMHCTQTLVLGARSMCTHYPSSSLHTTQISAQIIKSVACLKWIWWLLDFTYLFLPCSLGANHVLHIFFRVICFIPIVAFFCHKLFQIKKMKESRLVSVEKVHVCLKIEMILLYNYYNESKVMWMFFTCLSLQKYLDVKHYTLFF